MPMFPFSQEANLGFNKCQQPDSQLTCNILQRFFSHLSSTQGWNIPKVMQFNRITSIDTRSNHVLDGKENKQLS